MVLEVLGFLVLLILLGIPVAIVVEFVLLWRRSGDIDHLRMRLDHLEREVAQLRQAWEAEHPAEIPKVVAVEPPSSGSIAEAPVPPRRRPAAPSPSTLLPPNADSLESWIGRQGLGWAAVVLLLFAAAFFLKYAFENRWIGELGRVSLGILGGIGLCLGGLRYHRLGWRGFSQMLTAGGVVLLYLATFGAFGYYHLIARGPAGFFLIVLVIETGLLALRYEAPAIAVMAVVGGLLNPVLLHSDEDSYWVLFPYLLLLDTGVVGLALFRRWRGIASLALLGTQGLFWVWYAQHYHPEKLAAALGVQLGFFALFLIHHLLVPLLRGRQVDVEELLRVPVNALFVTVAGYVLLNEDYHRWLSSLALGMASIYTAVGWVLLRRRPQDPWHVLVMASVSLAFLAMVFPLEADAAWIGLGWAVEGLALWWFGLRAYPDNLFWL